MKVNYKRDSVCKCGKIATHKAKVPIRIKGGSQGGRVVIGGPYYWCAECVKTEKLRTPGTIAVPF